MNNAAQTYSVGEFAKIAGVTVRALHFYDEVGLLKPIRQRHNRRRQYRQLDLLRLQQIVTLRTLGFSLSEIETLLTHPEYDIAEALKAQKSAVDAQITQFQQVSYALSLTMERLQQTLEIDWTQVTTIIRSLTDTDKSDWLKQFYPTEWCKCHLAIPRFYEHVPDYCGRLHGDGRSRGVICCRIVWHKHRWPLGDRLQRRDYGKGDCCFPSRSQRDRVRNTAQIHLWGC